MPAWLDLVLTLIFYVWMFLVLWFMWLMWKNSAKQTQKMQQALIDATTASASAAQKAADAVYTFIEKKP